MSDRTRPPEARAPTGPPAIRLTQSDRFLAWIVTGPVGRLVAFVLDFVALIFHGVRRRLGGSE